MTLSRQHVRKQLLLLLAALFLALAAAFAPAPKISAPDGSVTTLLTAAAAEETDAPEEVSAEEADAAEESVTQMKGTAKYAGWQYLNGHWYYYMSDGKTASGWHKIGGKWYFFNKTGVMQTGWLKYGGKKYYLASDGAMQTGWLRLGGKWYFFSSSGAMRTGWLNHGGKRYFLNKNGVMKTGWLTRGSKKYYFESSGAMKTGWLCLDGKWYYLTKNGPMKTGWLKYSGDWYFLNKYGIMKTGWITYGGKRYFLGSDGAMQTGWICRGGSWYYLDSSGAMKTGWLTLRDSTYYLGKDGVMLTGKHRIGGKTYEFRPDGLLMMGRGKVVVLDPGHSGVVAGGTVPLGPGSDERKDADSEGTRGVATGVWEYQLNLAMAFKIRTELESRGYTVYMTRADSDGPLDCIERAEAANSRNADLFVRLHANASSDSSRTGAMTICITPDNPYIPSMYEKSRLLSDKLLSCYVRATGCRREYVWETDTMTGNNWCKVPATLIEFGYMTNAAEDRRMQDPAYQDRMTQGVCNGIDAYISAVQ